ncbi:DUF2231 domain-containing protein [Longispora albida]|uniref:DUF2231 domain-containing protein n=1 Tax=Longispora albida TaxID=203523 RepID=UPI00036325FD|nr:DUF2231 domain-containing protein [Longispora albida]
MRSSARALGHAIHPMLIVFPLGLLSTAVVFDILHLFTNRAGFQVAAAYMIGAGVLGGLVAGVFGFADWLGIPPGTRARRVGAVHGLGNVVVLVLFAVSWLLRADSADWAATGVALGLSFAGAVLSVLTGWLGGELVQRHGVSVDDDASLDATSTLASRPGGGRPRQV